MCFFLFQISIENKKKYKKTICNYAIIYISLCFSITRNFHILIIVITPYFIINQIILKLGLINMRR